MKLFLIIFCLIGFLAPAQVLKTGADLLLEENLHLISGKNIGLVTNHTAVLSDGRHLADVLHANENCNLKVLFGPEHGIRGDASAGDVIEHDRDSKTGVHVYSLYGKDRKPTPEMLKGVDVLIFDIQDIGARFYTYISTLFYVLQAGAENNIPVIVLDRPNPINGVYVDGPIRKEKLSSFVGIAPIPVTHGMTVGELAEMFSGEGWLKTKEKPSLTIVKMKGWERNKYYDDYELNWIPPSPNIPEFETALVYPGTCLIEGVNVSEGRGTKEPFLKIGAPYIKPAELIKKLKDYGTAAVYMEETEFTPVSIPGMSENPKYKDQKCRGIIIKVRNRERFESVQFGIKLVSAIHALYPGKFEFIGSFDRLAGDTTIKESILKGKSPDAIIDSYKKELKDFLQIRGKYLLYN
jgi:uncharacterized protein YbbC (DUF1343 family)